MSSFSGLSVALSSLQSQQRRMDVIAQNLANVNTPGYTRQRAELAEVGPAGPNIWGNTTPAGNGVKVTGITRIGDDITLNRVRGHQADSNYLTTMAGNLSGVETGLNEPSDSGLTEQLGALTSALSDAAASGGGKNGDDTTLTVAVQKAQSVADTVRSGYAQVNDRWAATRSDVDNTLTDFNSAAKSVAKLNEEIHEANLAGSSPNALLDQRDTLLTKMSGLAGVTIAPSAPGSDMVKVSIGGAAVVDGNTVTGDVVTTGGTAMGDPTGLALKGAAGTTALDASSSGLSGSIAAKLETLNTTLPGVAAGYDKVAANLTSVMNANGNPGFFSGTAADFTVALGDPSSFKVSTPGTLDGKYADDMVKAMRDTATSPVADWKKLVGSVGTASNSFATRSTAAQANLSAAEAALQSTTGVDLDEEMTNLVATQRSYQAAGKLMATVDSMLDTLINHTGR